VPTVLRARDATIYELPAATPLLTGPARAAVTTLQSSRIEGHVARAGTYFLRVRYSPYWTVTRGSFCLAPGPSAMTQLRATAAASFTIQSAETPGGVLSDLFDEDSGRC
jgi:hypothetical protein